MAQSYFLQLNNNDDLSKVIKKCNTNFMALATQKQQQDIVNSEQIGDALSDVVGMIEDEADNRRQADIDLDNAINSCAKSADLATVATSGDYNDLANKPSALDFLEYSHDDILWKIENNTVGEVMKKTTVTGYTDLVVRCVGEDGNPCYTPLALIPKDSYQNYTANGKTFKMQINTSDNNRLWWVVPTGTWELWMR